MSDNNDIRFAVNCLSCACIKQNVLLIMEEQLARCIFKESNNVTHSRKFSSSFSAIVSKIVLKPGVGSVMYVTMNVMTS